MARYKRCRTWLQANMVTPGAIFSCMYPNPTHKHSIDRIMQCILFVIPGSGRFGKDAKKKVHSTALALTGFPSHPFLVGPARVCTLLLLFNSIQFKENL